MSPITCEGICNTHILPMHAAIEVSVVQYINE